ncbi:MAG: hotdog fold thioesterase [Thermoflexibacter sp.]|nr:hotdog fold thioesterase [Thermoflexibacter sp.]
MNARPTPTLTSTLGIEITEIGEDYIAGKMPVDHRTHQPMGILHGGASVAFAETLGSIGGWLALPDDSQYCVGLDINANHIRSVKSGYVYGKAVPLHIGRNTQVWEIKITNEEQKLVCISRLTLAILSV